MQNVMDGKSCCTLLCAEAQHMQLARPFCAEPLVTFHVCPEAPSQLPLSEDLSLLPFLPESFCSEPCPFPCLVPHASLHKREISSGAAFIRKRNERERQRVKCVNEGYAKLRLHLPKEYLEKRLSKVETLRAAIKYIRYLQSVLCPDSVLPGKAVLEPKQPPKASSKQTQLLKAT